MIKGKVAAVLIGLSATMFGSISTAAAQGKELVVATDTAFVPFEFKQGSTYTGFDIDLWAAIAKELNLKYKLQPMDFNGIIPGLQTKNIDVALAGITIRDDRKKVIDFSDPYYESGLAILVSDKNNDIKAAKDLSGKTVAVKTGTATVDFLKAQVPEAKLKLFPNIDNAYLELATAAWMPPCTTRPTSSTTPIPRARPREGRGHGQERRLLWHCLPQGQRPGAAGQQGPGRAQGQWRVRQDLHQVVRQGALMRLA